MYIYKIESRKQFSDQYFDLGLFVESAMIKKVLELIEKSQADGKKVTIVYWSKYPSPILRKIKQLTGISLSRFYDWETQPNYWHSFMIKTMIEGKFYRSYFYYSIIREELKEE